MWLVSTRRIGCLPTAGAAPRYTVRRYDAEYRAWQAATLDELLVPDPSGRITVVYVHGNRFAYSDSVQHGWLANNPDLN